MTNAIELWRRGLISRAELHTSILIEANEVGFDAARALVPEGELAAFDRWASSLGRAPRSEWHGLDDVHERVVRELRHFYRAG